MGTRGERFRYLKWKEGVEPLPATPQQDFLHRMTLFYPDNTSVPVEEAHPVGQLRQLLNGKSQNIR